MAFLGARHTDHKSPRHPSAHFFDQIPKLRAYRFVVSRDELVIVVPRDRSVALVLDR